MILLSARLCSNCTPVSVSMESRGKLTTLSRNFDSVVSFYADALIKRQCDVGPWRRQQRYRPGDPGVYLGLSAETIAAAMRQAAAAASEILSYCARRRIQPSRPRPEPNNQTAAGIGTTFTLTLS